jgi:hypothetical protein
VPGFDSPARHGGSRHLARAVLSPVQRRLLGCVILHLPGQLTTTQVDVMVCDLPKPNLFEAGQRLRFVRSSNVMAAGMKRDGSAVLVRFEGTRWYGTLYEYPSAGQTELASLMLGTPTAPVLRRLEAQFGSQQLDVELVDALEETWGVCDECHAVVSTEVCPECGGPTPLDFVIDRCSACRTYVVSRHGRAPLAATCAGWNEV